MKALIVVAAAALAFPVYAQQKHDTTLPNAQERQHNRGEVEPQALPAQAATVEKQRDTQEDEWNRREGPDRGKG
jgi:uncharacterized protein YdeI (BOF family)